MSAMAAEVATRPTHFWRDRLCAPTLCSPAALSGSAPPPRRRLFVETWAPCGSPLSSGPLITEAIAGPPGLSRTQKRLPQRRTQFQRLRDGPAWQRADEVREVFVQFQRTLQQRDIERTSHICPSLQNKPRITTNAHPTCPVANGPIQDSLEETIWLTGIRHDDPSSGLSDVRFKSSDIFLVQHGRSTSTKDQNQSRRNKHACTDATERQNLNKGTATSISRQKLRAPADW